MFKSMFPMATDKHKIPATVVLMRKTMSDYNDLGDWLSGPADTIGEGLGIQKVSLQLVSADKTEDPSKGGKVGAPVTLPNWNTIDSEQLYGESKFNVNFEWNEDFGTPGAILVRNTHHGEFYLKTVTLENVPGRGQILFVCNSWVYNHKNVPGHDRIFFANKTYLPHETPEPLRKYREEELRILRGNGKGELKEWDRVYDYALYNDLGDPDKGSQLARPVLGGSAKYPYPRRGRTGRKPSKSDPNSESRDFPELPGTMYNVYVPRDEQFSRLKKSDFNAYNLKGFLHDIMPTVQAIVNLTPKEFDTFKDIDELYFNGIQLPTDAVNQLVNNIPLPLMIKEIFRSDGEQLVKFPVPQVIQADTNRPPTAWRTDEEFAREMLAGVNPIVIRLLKEFPPTSNLDPEVYGHQNSSMTKQDIEYNLDGLSVEEALRTKRLFILDHHDTVIPYLRRINTTETKTYASRALLFLRGDNTLKPVAIELSSLHPEGDKFGAASKVYTPAQHGVEGSIWQLAKAYVAVNDGGYHQLISHWLNTHAVIEPFLIATNRQLSVVHPIYKILHPHFRDTMAINALAREILVNADGLLEKTFYPGKYSMEMSSEIYKSWNFLDQALPNDLKKRGIAVGDINSLDDLDRLLIKDYPYAVDGLKIWFAIEKWVRDYCSFYYKRDEMVQQDPELQAWWKELREVGHGDKKHEPWWPKMQTLKELIESCTIIIWIASALHAAVNFGQYAYGGYSPNRPTQSRRFMPEKGTPEYAELEKNFEKAFFKTITSQLNCLTGVTVVEVLSRHATDEVYLGQREPDWTTDAEPVAVFKAFHDRLAEIEEEIISMNKDKKLKNRVGPVNVPYTLLFPTGEVGLSGKGIPNSISI
ncbi:probable linoleate 9S-lipoxygenase 5 isoform X1 [Durio zibethinus]|uniref:Lipoxygenase n=1 Tax=Durio zibethinus TaxID=66656 RepID=A0A6P5WVD2_DURZI|nr:probable linoleate 9S-lipoxygenase 5 isoform X1 [Durio zibethinus]